MSPLLPLFPLGTVALPGTDVPLHIFEERYRDLVSDLLAIDDPEQRLFGIVAIREGYEVGEHSSRSMYRVGCLMQLRSAQRYPDGRYDVVAEGRGRFRVRTTDTEASYLRAAVEWLDEPPGGRPEELAEAEAAARAALAAYGVALEQLTGARLQVSLTEDDPTALSYELGAAPVVPLTEQQRLLETPTTLARLRQVGRLLRDEQTLIRAVPSLPATQIARSGWSPN